MYLCLLLLPTVAILWQDFVPKMEPYVYETCEYVLFCYYRYFLFLLIHFLVLLFMQDNLEVTSVRLLRHGHGMYFMGHSSSLRDSLHYHLCLPYYGCMSTCFCHDELHYPERQQQQHY